MRATSAAASPWRTLVQSITTGPVRRQDHVAGVEVLVEHGVARQQVRAQAGEAGRSGGGRVWRTASGPGVAVDAPRVRLQVLEHGRAVDRGPAPSRRGRPGTPRGPGSRRRGVAPSPRPRHQDVAVGRGAAQDPVGAGGVDGGVPAGGDLRRRALVRGAPVVHVHAQEGTPPPAGSARWWSTRSRRGTVRGEAGDARPSTLPPSSQPRRRTASAWAGLRSNAADLGGRHRPALADEAGGGPGGEAVVVGGLDGAAVALGRHVQGDRSGDRRREDRGEPAGAAALVAEVDVDRAVGGAAVAQLEQVADVVEQRGGDQLVGRRPRPRRARRSGGRGRAG